MIQYRVGSFNLPTFDDLTPPTVSCSYPKANKLAVGARPTRCGQTANTLAGVPYPDENGMPRINVQIVCVPHAVEVAVWRFNYTRPPAALNRDEWLFLRQYCGLQGPLRTNQ